MIDRNFYGTLEDLFCDMFDKSREQIEDVDMEWFIDYFMTSDYIDRIDREDVRIITMTSRKLFELIKKDLKEYPKSDKDQYSYYGDEIYWCAMQYVNLYFESNKPLRYIYSKINIQTMLRNFYHGHQRSFQNCSQLLIKDFCLDEYDNIK